MVGVEFPIKAYEIDAPTSEADKILSAPWVADWQAGLQPMDLAFTPARDPLVAVVVVVLVALILFNYRSCTRMFSNLGQELFGTRERENAFNETSANDTRTFIVLIVQLCVCEALLLFLWFRGSSPSVSFGQIDKTLGVLFALVVGTYLFRFAAYATVGWTFAGISRMKIWLRGFNSSEGLLSCLLILPTMIALFYPEYSVKMIIFSAILLILARFCFIFKGIRIFYTNFFSSLYFILYLCTLEIIPLIIAYFAAASLCEIYY